VEFLDVSTLVSASKDGSIKVWDVASGTSKDTVVGEKFTFSEAAAGTEQRVGRFLVTSKGDMVLVHHADGGEASDGEFCQVGGRLFSCFVVLPTETAPTSACQQRRDTMNVSQNGHLCVSCVFLYSVSGS
jgi:WD40 repeat protein